MGHQELAMLYKFDSFDFAADTLVLSRNGETVPLKPQAARFLSVLLEAAPAVVSRNRLIAALWPDGRIVEFDQSLNAYALQIRRALGASDGRSEYIETIPKRGYRFAGVLEDPIRRRSRNVFLAGVLLLLPVLGALAWAFVHDANSSGRFDSSLTLFEREYLLEARHGLALGDSEALEASRQAYSRLSVTRVDMAESRGGYALSTALLAGMGARNWSQWTGDAEHAAHEALRIDPGEPMALTALAYIHLYRDWDVDRAILVLEQALEADPDAPIGLAVHSVALAARGDILHAAERADQAALADPVSMSVRSDRCWIWLYARDYARAAQACRWALDLQPENDYSRLGLAESLRLSGRPREALALFDASPRLESSPLETVEADADTSWRQFTCRLADQLEASPRPRSAVFQAALHTECGRLEDAIVALETGLATRESGMLFLSSDPRFDSLRDDPRFVALLACIGPDACAR